MSKKPRKRKPRAGDAKALSAEELERNAQDALVQGRWRDAIDGFKTLLKQEPRAAWQTALADAYAGRAGELSAKGMHKEALAIWENRAALRPDAPPTPEHAALLVRLGRPQALLGLLGEADSPLPKDQQQALRAQLAARVLGGDRSLLAELPEDEPVRNHAEAALAALGAYCDGDDDALGGALAQIPFRSPYRDFAQLLKALLRHAEAPNEAQALLARIDAGSPFAALKRAAELGLGGDDALLAAAGSASEPELRVACALRGWPPERLAVLQDLRRLGGDPSPKDLLRLLQRHAKVVGTDWARRMSLPLVAQGGSDGVHWLSAAGGARLNLKEQALVAAWRAEGDRDLWEVQWWWNNHAELLATELKGPGDPDQRLRIALMLRRCDAQFDLLDQPEEELGEASEVAAEDLLHSLRWDPDDQATYLRLIRWYCQLNDLKGARRVLAQAQERWPEAMAVLEAAMDVALEGGAFKKAAGLARRILGIDPINSGVRRRLVDSHLAHARKQILKSRVDLGRKELLAALDWTRDEATGARLRLGLAILDLGKGDKPAIERLRERYAVKSPPLRDRIELMLAADDVCMRPDYLARKLGLKKPKLAGRDDLLASLAQLRAAFDQDRRQSSKDTDRMLTDALLKAPWRALSRAELETACDTLDRWQLHQVRERAAGDALKRWPGAPIFEFHRFEGRYPRGFDYRTMGDLDRLRSAWSRARADGDMRTATRIERVLPMALGFSGMPAPFPSPSMLLDDEDDDLDDFDDFDDIGLEGVDERLDALLDVAEQVGLVAALEAIGVPREVLQAAREMERELGREGALDMFSAYMEQIGGLDLGGGLPLPPSLPPARKPAKPAKESAPAKPSDDDDDPQQLELF